MVRPLQLVDLLHSLFCARHRRTQRTRVQLAHSAQRSRPPSEHGRKDYVRWGQGPSARAELCSDLGAFDKDLGQDLFAGIVGRRSV